MTKAKQIKALNDLVVTWKYSAKFFKEAATDRLNSGDAVDIVWGHQYEGEALAYKLCAKELQQLINKL